MIDIDININDIYGKNILWLLYGIKNTMSKLNPVMQSNYQEYVELLEILYIKHC